MEQRVRSKGEQLRAERAAKQAQAVVDASVDTVMIAHFTAVIVDYWGLTWADIVGPSHSAEITEARRALVYLLVEDVGLTFSALARLMERDHSTMCHHYQRMRPLVADATLPEVATALREVRADVSRRIRESALTDWQHQRFWQAYRCFVVTRGRPLYGSRRVAAYAS